MDNFMIAFLILLGLIFLSRFVSEKANKHLDSNKKAELIDLFSKVRIYTYGILIGIIGLFFASLKFNWIDPQITYIIYVVSIFIFIIATSYFSYDKLKKNGFPNTYIKFYLISTSIRFLGLIIFIALIS